METKSLLSMPCPDCGEMHSRSTKVCPYYRDEYPALVNGYYDEPEPDDDEPTVEQLDGWIEYVYGSK